jgi:hypothetical protein
MNEEHLDVLSQVHRLRLGLFSAAQDRRFKPNSVSPLSPQICRWEEGSALR